ncbi:dopamine N-acetyltransferase-like [Diachasma alloeum]|uniref:dopamine N-acetyltransferase-like n=1 Tax=Diachasma alloeum TaxID=454923 RepID=UPI0007383A32|nr:dopamine N-acetyltransferase-like [Diachasma alloeum]
MLRIVGNLARNAIQKARISLPRVIQSDVKLGDIQFRRSNETKCETPEYVSRIAVPTDYDYVVNFMCNTYFKSEPSMVNIGLANQDPSPVLIDLMYKQIKDGMTIIILNEEGCIIGAAVNAGMSPWDPAGIRDIANCVENKDLANLLRFFAKLAEAPNLWETHHTNRFFECSCVAVDPQYRGTGIATKLIHDSWMLARDCRCRLFRIDCSSKYTAKIAQKFGWECVMSIPYSSHMECDEFVFKNIRKPHDTVDIYIDFPTRPKKSS